MHTPSPNAAHSSSAHEGIKTSPQTDLGTSILLSFISKAFHQSAGREVKTHHCFTKGKTFRGARLTNGILCSEASAICRLHLAGQYRVYLVQPRAHCGCSGIDGCYLPPLLRLWVVFSCGQWVLSMHCKQTALCLCFCNGAWLRMLCGVDFLFLGQSSWSK